MAAVRYTWMFRAAAVIHLLLGASAAWRFGLTNYDPPHRLWGVGFGVAGMLVGVFLFRLSRFAILISALGAGIVAILAAMAAPLMRGPVILAFAAVAIVFASYAALAGRSLLEPPV